MNFIGMNNVVYAVCASDEFQQKKKTKKKKKKKKKQKISQTIQCQLTHGII